MDLSDIPEDLWLSARAEAISTVTISTPNVSLALIHSINYKIKSNQKLRINNVINYLFPFSQMKSFY